MGTSFQLSAYRNEVPPRGFIMIRLSVLVTLSVGLGSRADAGERSSMIHRASCTVVRYYVAKYTAWGAETWGATQRRNRSEIAAARRCVSANRNGEPFDCSAVITHGEWSTDIASLRQIGPRPA